MNNLTIEEACQVLQKKDGSPWIVARKPSEAFVCANILQDYNGQKYVDEYSFDDLNEIMQEEYNTGVELPESHDKRKTAIVKYHEDCKLANEGLGDCSVNKPTQCKGCLGWYCERHEEMH